MIPLKLFRVENHHVQLNSNNIYKHRELPVKVTQVKVKPKNSTYNFDHYINRTPKRTKVCNNIFPRDEVDPMEDYRKNKNPLIMTQDSHKGRRKQDTELVNLLNELKKGIETRTKQSQTNYKKFIPRATTPLNSTLPKHRKQPHNKDSSITPKQTNRTTKPNLINNTKVIIKNSSR